MTMVVLGVALPDLDQGQLRSSRARAVLRAVQSRSEFELIQLRTNDAYDLIVVDCVAAGVPTRNAAGIDPRERLALAIPTDDLERPDVFALRADFPAAIHISGHAWPATALCVSEQAWVDARRTWTPQRHLDAITNWLRGTATGTLHRPEQRLEPVYFEPPTQVVLPDDLFQRAQNGPVVLTGEAIDRRVIRTQYAGSAPGSRYVTFVLVMQPADPARALELPGSLGVLEEQWQARGSSIIEKLSEAIRAAVPTSGIPEVKDQEVLIVLVVPLRSAPGEAATAWEVRCFIIPHSLVALGTATGDLFQAVVGRPYCVAHRLGDGPAATAWRTLDTLGCSARFSVSVKDARDMSGIQAVGADDHRLLAGVGALGSALLEVWTREQWGLWTVVDPDHVEPHNTVRHVARQGQIGWQKVQVAGVLSAATYGRKHVVNALPVSILDAADPRLREALTSAKLIVDATTTLAVPRELARRDDVSRVASTFISPSGNASVLLLEDAARAHRVDVLEARYYAGVLRGELDREHLALSPTHVRVGAGCRDASFVISYGTVLRHAGLLAEQIRLRSAANSASITVWSSDTSGSTVACTIADVGFSTHQRGGWTVILLACAIETMRTHRRERLPSETGGIVLGYIDHVARRIYALEVAGAPADSKGTPSSFVRGADGVVAHLEEVRRRTAGMVRFVGEWHSHPRGHSARPSRDDLGLIQAMGQALAQDGDPALMLIVADDDVTVSVAYAPAGDDTPAG